MLVKLISNGSSCCNCKSIIRTVVDEHLSEHYKDNDRVTVIDFHDDCAVVYIDMHINEYNIVMMSLNSLELVI